MRNLTARIDKVANKFIYVACVATTLYYLYTGFFGFGDRLWQLAPLLALGMFITFIKKPITKSAWTRPLDYAFAVASTAILSFMIYEQRDLYIYVTPPTGGRLVILSAFVFLVLDAARRTMGLGLTLMGVGAIIYALFGDHLPMPWYHIPLSWSRLVGIMGYGEMGIFGVPMTIAGHLIVFFIIFSSFLSGTGAGAGFVALGTSLFGRYRGGPAKASVLSSALFGTVSGSVVANVTTTGSFTIPLMKKTGYSPTMSAVVEAVASTGGQLMPPIMGAAAFIMADYIGVPYRDVAIAAALPAVLYFLSLFVVVDLEAAKQGLKGLSREDRPTIRQTLASAWIVIAVLGVLIYFMFVVKVDALRAVLNATVAMVILSLSTRNGRKGLWHIGDILKNGASDMTILTIACAASGVVIGMLYITNIGVQLSGILVDFSRGIPLLLLVLAMLASFVLGLGLPTTPCYLVLATVVAPAMIKMGFPLMASHLFILYFGILSSITPPVALAAFAAGSLAGADVMKVGWVACWFGLIAFLIPYFFMYSPALLLNGGTLDIAVGSISAVIGTIGFAAMLQGYLLDKTNILQRVLLGMGGLLMVYAQWVTAISGLALLAFVALWQLWGRRKRAAALTASP